MICGMKRRSQVVRLKTVPDPDNLPSVTAAAVALARSSAGLPSRVKASRANGRLGGAPKRCPLCGERMRRNDNPAGLRWVCVCGHQADIIHRRRNQFDPFNPPSTPRYRSVITLKPKETDGTRTALPDPDSFWSRAVKSDGCWVWKFKRAISRNPRAMIAINGTATPAARVAWILTNGDIPSGKQILHKCDNPSCINPDHLYLGTASDNMLDRYERNPSQTRVKSVIR